MKAFPPQALFFAIAFLIFLPAAHAQSRADFAGLEQDVSSMREEIRKLRDEVENLRTRLEQSQSKTGESEQQRAKTRLEIRAEVNQDLDKRFTAMAEATNRALADMKKQVNDALAKSGNATANTSTRSVDAPTPSRATPGDMPKNGIRYTIKAGDSVYKIARDNKSKAAWIFTANRLSPDSTIQAGREIFIPQKDDTPESAQ